MKSNFLKFAVLLIVIVVALSSCSKKKIYEVTWEELKGTQWKLDHVVRNHPHEDHDDRRIIIEPQDCDTCFTLTFDAERIGYLTGVSILNTVDVKILTGSDFQQNRPNAIVSVTDLEEPFDGNKYCDFLRSVRTIYCDHAELGLVWYLEGEDNVAPWLLIYKRINQ